MIRKNGDARTPILCLTLAVALFILTSCSRNVSSPAPPHSDFTRPTSTTTIPLAGTAFNQTIRDGVGTELSFIPQHGHDLSISQVIDAGHAESESLTSHRVHSATWVEQDRMQVDLTNPDEVNYARIVSQLSDIGKRFSISFSRSYAFTENAFIARSLIPQSEASGVVVSLVPTRPPTATVLNQESRTLAIRLNAMSVNALWVQLIVVDPSGTTLWRVIALGEGPASEPQLVSQTIVHIFGNAVNSAQQRSSSVAFVGGSAASTA